MSTNLHGVQSWLARVRDAASADLDNKPLLFTGLVGAAALLALYVALRPRKQRKTKKPPGPLIPFRNNPNKTDLRLFDRLVQQYGSLFGISLFRMNLLFLCDADVLKEALVAQPDLFAGRMDMSLIRLTGKGNGVLFIDGAKWQDTRRFILSVLRTFGFGKNITERIIQEELNAVSSEFIGLNGQPTFPRIALLRSAANVICQLVFGERCGNEDEFEFLVKTANGITSPPVGAVTALFSKWLLKVPGDLFGLKKYMADNAVIEQYLMRKINQHKATIDWDNERDLIDAYLREIRRREQEKCESDSFTDFQAIRVILELFLAGMDTTGTTLNWCLFLMTKYPDVQKRVQDEIDSTIGDKVPQFSDRAKLVYTTAVLHEVERFASISPFTIPHRTREETELRGYTIAKNTMVLGYLMGAHRDARKWKNPRAFDPTHFYDESSKTLVNLQHLIPFSVGKRACLGESLATQELFVMFTGLMQRFRFEVDASLGLPPIDEDYSALPFRLCSEYKVVIRERESTQKKEAP